jgi:hypothetical protein
MATYTPDTVAKAFREHCPRNWKARPYMTTKRASGVFNAVSFSYKNGLISFVMDCDYDLGTSFTVIFNQVSRSTFKDFCNAIQKGLFRIIDALNKAGLETCFPTLSDYRSILWAINHETGVVTHLRVLPVSLEVPTEKIGMEDLL